MFKWIDFHFFTFIKLINIFSRSIQTKDHANPTLSSGYIQQCVFLLDLIFFFFSEIQFQLCTLVT